MKDKHHAHYRESRKNNELEPALNADEDDYLEVSADDVIKRNKAS